ncbi:DUF4179 domain-containing protein [Tissierella carlieri]|uniref:DUF4179 domain-containing protein n=1 Tax=Tissierella carlieri TaxID=689904 RepID=A0ABT1SDU9_9FIRM|nr:DUF4179 domain-containing protein [Tissierella carlieri]
MDCNLIKDKMLDYIDGVLNEEEEILFRDHIEECNKCSIEYKETKSAIDYIESNVNKINVIQTINLKLKEYRIKPIIKFRRTTFIAIILLFILMVTAIATDSLENLQWWKKDSEKTITAWEKLLNKGVGQKLNVSVIDKDIKVTAEGVIADELNTIIFLRIEDLKGDLRFGATTRIDEDSFQIQDFPIKVGGDIFDRFEKANNLQGEELPIIASYSNLYSEEKNTIRVMVSTRSLNVDEGNINVYIDKLSTVLNKDDKATISIEGSWNLKIPAKKIKSKSYNVDKTIEFDGNEVVIQKITIAPTKTNIEYKMKNYNEKHGYSLEDVRFSIRYRLKKYGYSTLSSRPGYIHRNPKNEPGYSIGNQILESLYLESPNRIKFIIESYEYAVEESKSYDIFINNLPQTIEYNGNKITIEEIVYNKDNTEVRVREDTSKNRKYSSSIFKITAKDNPSAFCRSMVTDYEFRDKKGRALKKGEGDGNSRLFYKEQKIELKNDLVWGKPAIHESKTEELIPEKFHVQGQRYIEYLNKETTIKLK